MKEHIRELAKDLMATSSFLKERSVGFEYFSKDSLFPYNLVLAKLSKQDAELAKKIDEIMIGAIALQGDSSVNDQISDL